MRKLKRNIMRKEFGNKNMHKEWAEYQINKTLDLVEKYGTKKDAIDALERKLERSKKDNASSYHIDILIKNIKNYKNEDSDEL